MLLKRTLLAASAVLILGTAALTAPAQTPRTSATIVPMPKEQMTLNAVVSSNSAYSCPVSLSMPVSPMYIDSAFRRIKLPADTARKAFTVMQESENKIAKILSESHPGRDMLDAIRTAPLDKAKLEQLADEAEKQESVILKERVGMWVQMMSLLTTEQQKQFWEALGKPAPAPKLPPAPHGKVNPPVTSNTRKPM